MNSIEEQIQEAIREGKFSNLAGEGKPVRLDDDTLVDPDWRLAYHLLRENGFSLPWLDERREIEEEIEGVLSTLEQAWEWWNSQDKPRPYNTLHRKLERTDQTEPGALFDGDWEQAKRVFEAEVKRINRRIFEYNLRTPSERFQLFQLKPENEITRITRGERRSSCEDSGTYQTGELPDPMC